MRKQTKRADVLQELAVKLTALYRETGGKGPAWQRVMREARALCPLPSRDWVYLVVCGVRNAEGPRA